MNKRILSLAAALLLNASSAIAASYQTLEYGDTGSDVKQMQEALIALGYLEDTADGKFGSKTDQAVRAFQSLNGLEVDGKAGSKTYAILFSDSAVGNGTPVEPPEDSPEEEEAPPEYDGDAWLVPDRTLRLYDKGDDVLSVQLRLQALKYFSGIPDGEYGTATATAVITFQSAHGLTVDGVAGPKTYAILFSDDAKPASEVGGNDISVDGTEGVEIVVPEGGYVALRSGDSDRQAFFYGAYFHSGAAWAVRLLCKRRSGTVKCY